MQAVTAHIEDVTSHTAPMIAHIKDATAHKEDAIDPIAHMHHA